MNEPALGKGGRGTQALDLPGLLFCGAETTGVVRRAEKKAWSL